MNNLIELAIAAQNLIERPEMRAKHAHHVSVLVKFCKPTKVSKRAKKQKELAGA